MQGDILMWKGEEQLIRCQHHVYHHVGDKWHYVCMFNQFQWGHYRLDGWQANQDPKVWRKEL